MSPLSRKRLRDFAAGVFVFVLILGLLWLGGGSP